LIGTEGEDFRGTANGFRWDERSCSPMSLETPQEVILFRGRLSTRRPVTTPALARPVLRRLKPCLVKSFRLQWKSTCYLRIDELFGFNVIILKLTLLTKN